MHQFTESQKGKNENKEQMDFTRKKALNYTKSDEKHIQTLNSTKKCSDLWNHIKTSMIKGWMDTQIAEKHIYNLKIQPKHAPIYEISAREE